MLVSSKRATTSQASWRFARGRLRGSFRNFDCATLDLSKTREGERQGSKAIGPRAGSDTRGTSLQVGA